MTPDARVAAAIPILDAVLDGASAEKTLTTWARKNRFAGSKDRAAVRDLVYEALRNHASFVWFSGQESGRGLMIGHAIRSGDLDGLFTGEGYGPDPLSPEEVALFQSIEDASQATRVDCPAWVWPQVVAQYGDAAAPIFAQMQQRASVFLRVNSAKGSVAAAIEALAEDAIRAAPHGLSKTALEVVENPRKVQQSRAYLSGLVELQDAASQAVSDVVVEALAGGNRILDYCAGGGGKALAMAAAGHHVTAHDASLARMRDIPVRAKRAGVAISVVDSVRETFDAVLCDVPCSGSGAWRRQPQAKWTLTQEALEALAEVQDSIIETAAGYVRPDGVLCYATCSLFEVENDARVDGFLSRHSGWTGETRKQFTPLDGGDGFFVAVLRRDA